MKKRERKPRGLLVGNTKRFVVLLALLVLPLAMSFPVSPLLTTVIATIELTLWLGATVVASQLLLPLPLHTLGERLDAWLAFTGWLFGLQRESYLVSDVSVRRTIARDGGSAPGVILVDGHSAVVTKRGHHHLRVLGPGAHFTQPFEYVPVNRKGDEPCKVREVVDLRRQIRFQPVRAQTKDGMYVKTMLIAQFQIDRDPDPKLDEHHFYRYDERAVHQAVMSERVDPQSSEHYDWTTLPMSLGMDALLQIISTYTLDELYAPREDDPNFSPPKMRIKLGEELSNALRDRLKERGIQLIFAGCAKIMPDDARVTLQRIDHWRALHQREITLEGAQVDAELTKKMHEARGAAQRNMILQILDGMRAGPDLNIKALISLRMVAALEEMFAKAADAGKDAAGSWNGPQDSARSVMQIRCELCIQMVSL